MKLLDQKQIYIGKANSETANCGFGGIAQLPDRTLLATWRVGSAKASWDGRMMLSESRDGGESWPSPREIFPSRQTIKGLYSEVKYVALAALGPDHLLAGTTWLDATDTAKPFVDPVTQEHLPSRGFLSESRDRGQSWGEWSEVEPSPYLNLPLVCGPIAVLPDGRWGCFFEVDNGEKWHHAVVKFTSDRGKTWGPAIDVAHDPTNRRLHWDQRIAVGRDGRLIAMLWTHDTQAKEDLNIHLCESRDGGRTWSKPHDTGLSGQVAHPVLLPDGRLVAICVGRYGLRSLYAAVSRDGGRTFDPQTLTIYKHQFGDLKTEHGVMDSCFYTFGRPDALADPDGAVHVVYYAGDDKVTGMYWAKISV